MALAPYTVTALAESDAEGTGGSNIIASAVVSFFDASTGGTAQTLYDNAASANPSTTKTTDAEGQVTVWMEPGNWWLSVNSGTRRLVTVTEPVVKTDSATDNTTGRVATYVNAEGIFGLGGTESPQATDLNALTDCGFYHAQASTANAPTIQIGCVQHFNYDTANGSAQLFANLQADEWYGRREISGTYQPWVEFWHDGNLVKTTGPTDATEGRVPVIREAGGIFGLGGRAAPAYPNTDLNNLTNVYHGWYADFLASVSTTNNWPENLTSVNYVLEVLYEERGATPRVIQKLDLIRYNGVQQQKRSYQRQLYGATWSAWVEDWHTGNLVKTTGPIDNTSGRVITVDDQGWFGLGNRSTFSLPVMADVDDFDTETGFWNTSAGVTLGTFPSGEDANGALLWNKRFGSGTGQGWALWSPDTSGARMYFKSWWNGGGSGNAWFQLYHDGNLNVNEFGAGGANRFVATGYASSSTVGTFILPISSFTDATSITVTSTFDVRDAGGATLATGVTPVIFASGCSDRIATIQVTGLSGLTAGEFLSLRAENATSKITVNF